MKKILVIIISLLLALPATEAASLTVAQKAMRTKMVTFLKEEGYVPEITTDGSIKFKIEGIIYFITLDERDTDPLYYTMSATFNYGDVVTRAKMDNIIAEINLYKAIKMTYTDNNYSVGAEVYLVNIDQFRYTFYKTKNVIQKALEEIPELAEKVGDGIGGSNYSSGSSYSSGVPLTYDNLFPLYGYYLGTPCKTFSQNGLNVQKLSSGSQLVDIGENQFWDFDKDGIMEAASIEEIPSHWAAKWGMDLSWSYNEWRNFLVRNNYTITNEESEVKNASGRKYLSGKILSTSPDRKIKFWIYFDGGNKNGEGYSRDSKNSCSYFNIKLNN